MSRIDIALQLHSVRKSWLKDPAATLEKAAEIGFRNIELFFESPHLARFDVPFAAAEMRERTRRNGLRIVSSQVVHHPFLDWDEVIRYLAEAGCEGITIPMHLYNLHATRTKPQEAEAFAEELNRLGRKCRESGLTLHYHNYYNEFERFDGRTIYDILLDATDPALVFFELDAYWTTRGGVDPVAWLDRVGTRCRHLQAQDMIRDAKNVNLVEVDGAFDNAFYPKLHTHFGDYTEIGAGVIDYPAILAKAREIGSIGQIIVSQTETGGRKEFESAEINLRALRKLLEDSGDVRTGGREA